MFNPNELILEKIRAVEEYDPATMELLTRCTQIEEPTLNFTCEGTQVVDAFGSEIVTFYDAQSGTFSFSNSLLSLDLMASQFGTKKNIGDTSNKILVPVTEVIDIVENVAHLKYTPVGTKAAEVKYAKVLNAGNVFGKTYEVSAADETGKFVVDESAKTLTFHNEDNVTGKVFVQYFRESENAVEIVKRTDTSPKTKTVLIHGIFHDPCNTNIVYAGCIWIPRAQPNPESVEVNLTPDGKHAAEYRLQKSYCDEDMPLARVIVTED